MMVCLTFTILIWSHRCSRSTEAVASKSIYSRLWASVNQEQRKIIFLMPLHVQRIEQQDSEKKHVLHSRAGQLCCLSLLKLRQKSGIKFGILIVVSFFQPCTYFIGVGKENYHRSSFHSWWIGYHPLTPRAWDLVLLTCGQLIIFI